MTHNPAIKTDFTPSEKRMQALSALPCRPLERHLFSSAEVVRDIASVLCSAIDGLRPRRMKIGPYADIRRFVVCLLVNFFDAWVIDPGCYLSIPLGREDYPAPIKGQKRPDLIYAAVINGVTGLEALGYLRREPHVWDPIKQRGLVTRFKATDKLAALLAPLPLSVVEVRERSPLIEIRPTHKERRRASNRNERCPKHRWPKVQRGSKDRMLRNLRVLNKALARQFNGLAIPDKELRTALGEDNRPVNVRNQAMHRIFQVGPQGGGRFYGPYWQQIEKGLRAHLRMAAPGHEPQATVELDFDSLHPTMIYATRKFPVKGDLYAIYPDAPGKNKALRDVVKPLMLTMLNAKSTSDAINSFKNAINTEDYPAWVKKNFNQTVIVTNSYECIDKKLAEMYRSCPPVKQLVFDITAHHYRIAEYFCSGAATWLMNEDSQIAEMIMLTMYREHGIVPLAIHDSFIVPASLEGALKATMERAFASRFAGITPGITKRQAADYPHTLDSSHLYSKLLAQWVKSTPV